MYKKEVFEAVFGKKNLDAKGMNEFVVRKDFTDILFNQDSIILEIYANLHHISPDYSIAKSWFDLTVGLHPGFFLRTKLEGQKVVDMKYFLAQSLDRLGKTNDPSKRFKVLLERRTSRVTTAFNFFKGKVITSEAMELIEDFFNEGEKTIFAGDTIGNIKFSKFSFVAMMLTDIRREDFEPKGIAFTSRQESAIKTFIFNHLKTYSTGRAEELRGTLLTLDKVRELLKNTIDDCSFELLYYSLLDSLDESNPSRTASISTIFRRILTHQTEIIITVK